MNDIKLKKLQKQVKVHSHIITIMMVLALIAVSMYIGHLITKYDYDHNYFNVLISDVKSNPNTYYDVFADDTHNDTKEYKIGVLPSEADNLQIPLENFVSVNGLDNHIYNDTFKINGKFYEVFIRQGEPTGNYIGEPIYTNCTHPYKGEFNKAICTVELTNGSEF